MAHALGVHVVADESCATRSDIARLGAVATAVNIKLEKCGGVRDALACVGEAQRLGLAVWFGTMLGSTLNSATVAHLLPLSELGGDLDGTLLVAPAGDVFEGGFDWRCDSGRAELPRAAPGIGVRCKPHRPSPAAAPGGATKARSRKKKM